MKSKLLLLSFLMLFTFTTNYAQSFATQSKIAVQGIARDNNNTAIASKSITFTFTLYYKDPGPVEVDVINPTITTDAFGVFSYVIDVNPTTAAMFANKKVFLKIEDGNGLISDEELNHVPYAISANNGVPTGSIMPFVGINAPQGWVLCNGQSLTTIAGSASLIALIGNNVPNLQGMFLRGTGTSPVNGQDGPALNATQDDGFEAHNHPGNTTSTGNHEHSLSDGIRGDGSADYGVAGGTSRNVGAVGLTTRSTFGGGSHNHTVSTNNVGTNETRPVNYGVNYIIKL